MSALPQLFKSIMKSSQNALKFQAIRPAHQGSARNTESDYKITTNPTVFSKNNTKDNLVMMDKDQRIPKLATVKQKFEFFLIVDFEATCDANTKLEPQEIIEFPCLKMNSTTFEINSTFHRYVRPEANPNLTPFCIELTGINQTMVQNELNFADTLPLFYQWMNEEGLRRGNSSDDEDANTDRPLYNYAFITCGEWDLKWLFHRNCQYAGLETPSQFKQWINIKKPFYATTKKYPRGLMHMLEILNLEPVGRHHCGLDDSKNVANIVKALCEMGCVLDYSSKAD